MTTSFRSDEQEVNGTYVARLSTAGKIRLSRRFRFEPRVLFINQGKNFGGGTTWVTRPRFTLSWRLAEFANVHLTSKTRYERHIRSDKVPDFNVYRQGFEFREDHQKVSPWILQEFFFDNSRGFFRSRSRAGLIFNLRMSRQLSVAYQLQSTNRVVRGWEPQHAIVCRFWYGSRFSWRGHDKRKD